MDAICRTTGFLAVAGHGVHDAIVNAAWTKAEAFFALPPERKQSARAPYPGYPYGYLTPETELLARSRGVEAPPDIKERFNGGPARAPAGLLDREALAFCFAPTIWPDAPDGFREAWSAYYAAMEDLAARIMRAFAVALTLPEDFFAPFLSAPVSALRALNYPALASPPKPGQIRAGAHTDYGSLTILLRGRAAPVLRFFSPAELGRRNRGARRLPRNLRGAQISAGPLGALSDGQIQVDDDVRAAQRRNWVEFEATRRIFH